MRATVPRLQAVGLRTWTVRPKYHSYRSPFAPQYNIPKNMHGVTIKQLGKFGLHFAGFGAAAGMAVLYFASSIPRVQRDILMNIPIIGDYWDRPIPPSDNPF